MPASVNLRGRANICASARLAAMERGIEAGDLRHMRRRFGDGRDRRQIVRLVQGRQRRQLRERGHDLVIDPDRRGVMRAAVHDAMSECQHRRAVEQCDGRFAESPAWPLR